MVTLDNVMCRARELCHFIGSTGSMFISEQNSSILDFKCWRPRICVVCVLWERSMKCVMVHWETYSHLVHSKKHYVSEILPGLVHHKTWIDTPWQTWGTVEWREKNTAVTFVCVYVFAYVWPPTLCAMTLSPTERNSCTFSLLSLGASLLPQSHEITHGKKLADTPLKPL